MLDYENNVIQPDTLTIDSQGWLDGARIVASPNCDDRKPECVADMVVIHNIHLPPQPAGATEFGGPDIERLFTNSLNITDHACYAELAQLRVSAHFLIRRDGEVLQFVSCNQRAWHAGVSNWQGRERCNDFSIGIEIEGSDFVPFTAIQYQSLDALLLAIQARYPIVHVVGHSEIAPERKTDPGPFFVWEKRPQSILELRQTGYTSES
ncbi:1,6-anhydro-N-acetylmuramyl-L-alanine amidase AmpD [Deefgea tanakiae]|uniref:1,6-anhydro-N-acetylmuramyl-L-alanine amidase AmpD n=1 Tax=Deefgea tanakiae TaxID=2865840 RepID=A0ABX8Z9B6_9NEIS|nr:1,6-anhydro-N-acetylmuramyl-L-alanine amidase AmpD [Deefgea tanakiae]QZA77924.1 1,6-anhydro-N-acetylmuramyl-L-alanine amidase AmpD [Deefgea tanakiae]